MEHPEYDKLNEKTPNMFTSKKSLIKIDNTNFTPKEPIVTPLNPTITKTPLEDENNALELINKQIFTNEIIVELSGEINTIQKAVDIAKPYTRIKLPAAIFKEHIVIRVPFLEIDSVNPEEPAIIISDNYPCFKIEELRQNETFKLKNVKLINRGLKKKEIVETTVEEPVTKKSIYTNSNLLESLELNFNIDQNVQEGISIENRGRISGISVFSGIVMVSNCQITLAYITSNTNTVTMGIYSERANIFLDTVLVKGNKDFLTVGVFSYFSNTKLNNCKLLNHKSGGLMTLLEPENYLTVCKTIFIDNIGSGMFAKGMGQMDIEDNLFEKTQGNGARISTCKRLKFVSNKCLDNLFDGAEFINCGGIIMLNYFYKNRGNGVTLKTTDPDPFFTSKFTKNSSVENGGSGITIMGKNNTVEINFNDKICYNNLSGIQVKEKGTPRIINNKIFENMNQGILIVSGSSATVVKNIIYKNIKANIAFGGVFSDETEILNNKIYDGRCEGIFVIEGKNGKIYNNEIYQNYDGLILVKSDCEVKDNIIRKNNRSGVLISDLSKPKFMNNTINENKFLGVFIRDRSSGIFTQNIIKNNLSQIYFSYDCKPIMDEIIKGNFVDGRYDYDYSCNIF